MSFIKNAIIMQDYEVLVQHNRAVLDGLRGSKILITGAFGMITSFLSGFLAYVADEFQLELDLQCRKSKKAEQYLGDYTNNKKIHIIESDIDDIRVANKGYDYIMHAASPADTTTFVKKPVDVIHPNIIGTWNMLNQLRKTTIKKYLYFSSNAIYGEREDCINELYEDMYGVVDPMGERACYIESKRLGEQMCNAFFRQYGVPTCSIRICHTYGPTFDIDNDTRIVPRIIQKIRIGDNIELYKDPNSVIQYTYIADMIMAILIVLVYGEAGENYNAGGDEVIELKEAARIMIESDTSIKSKLIEKEIDDKYQFGKGKGVHFTRLSNDKIKKIGWRPLFNNEEGFRRTIRSYLFS